MAGNSAGNFSFGAFWLWPFSEIHTLEINYVIAVVGVLADYVALYIIFPLCSERVYLEAIKILTPLLPSELTEAEWRIYASMYPALVQIMVCNYGPMLEYC